MHVMVLVERKEERRSTILPMARKTDEKKTVALEFFSLVLFLFFSFSLLPRFPYSHTLSLFKTFSLSLVVFTR